MTPSLAGPMLSSSAAGLPCGVKPSAATGCSMIGVNTIGDTVELSKCFSAVMKQRTHQYYHTIRRGRARSHPENLSAWLGWFAAVLHLPLCKPHTAVHRPRTLRCLSRCLAPGDKRTAPSAAHKDQAHSSMSQHQRSGILDTQPCWR